MHLRLALADLRAKAVRARGEFQLPAEAMGGELAAEREPATAECPEFGRRLGPW